MSDDARLRTAKARMTRFDAMPADVRAIARETDSVDDAMYLVRFYADPERVLAMWMADEQREYEMMITDIMAGRE